MFPKSIDTFQPPSLNDTFSLCCDYGGGHRSEAAAILFLGKPSSNTIVFKSFDNLS
jgi:hypothetical protein